MDQVQEHEHEIPEDPNGKGDVSGFQLEYLRECGEAAEAGFPVEDVEPVEMVLGENATQEDFDAMWAEVGQ